MVRKHKYNFYKTENSLIMSFAQKASTVICETGSSTRLPKIIFHVQARYVLLDHDIYRYKGLT